MDFYYMAIELFENMNMNDYYDKKLVGFLY